MSIVEQVQKELAGEEPGTPIASPTATASATNSPFGQSARLERLSEIPGVEDLSARFLSEPGDQRRGSRRESTRRAVRLSVHPSPKESPRSSTRSASPVSSPGASTPVNLSS